MPERSASTKSFPNGPFIVRILGSLTIVGAAAGLAIGLWEAALLYRTPRYPTLIAGEAGIAVFFVAPLADMMLYGLVGILLNTMAKLTGPLCARARVLSACILAGMACAHVMWMLTLVHMWVGNLTAIEDGMPAIHGFAAGFLAGVFLATIFVRPLTRILDDKADWPLQKLAWGIVATMLFLGIGAAALHVTPHRSTGSSSALRPGQVSGPNIILITLDTVRADHLSCYGYDRPTTPNLDHLASRGILFENAISSCSWTLPSHASIFTSLLPHQHGANGGMPEPSGVWNLAEVLRMEGYETAGFSSNTMFGQAAWGLGQGFGEYWDYSPKIRYNLALTLAGRAIIQPLYERLSHFDVFCRRDAREVNQEVSRWLARRSSRPYFLFVNYFDAHDTYVPPAPYDQRFGRLADELARRVCFGHGLALKEPLTVGEHQKVVAAYDNGLAYVDEQFGKLMEMIARAPDAANTYVIVTSDHGEAFGEHGIYGHGWFLYRELIHVPLLIVGPAIPQGLRISHVARTRQIFPTVLDFALHSRLTFPQTTLERFWRPGYVPGPWDDNAISELSPGFPNSGTPPMISLTTSQWQYIHDSTGKDELFDWRSDPLEKINLAGSAAHAEKTQELAERLRIIMTESRRPWRGPEYLTALDRPGKSYLRELAFRPLSPGPPDPTRVPVGSSQTTLGPDPSGTQARPFPSEQEMLESIPYR